MPSNYVLINNGMEYIVPDKRMEDLLSWLERNSHKARTCAGNPPGTVVDEANKPEVIG